MIIVGDVDEDICQFKHFPKGTPLLMRVLELAPGISCDAVFQVTLMYVFNSFSSFLHNKHQELFGISQFISPKSKTKNKRFKKTRLKTRLTKKASCLIIIT